MAAKKKSKKQVTITIDSDTLEKLVGALTILGAPGHALELHVDDPDLKKKLTKKAGKKG